MDGFGAVPAKHRHFCGSREPVPLQEEQGTGRQLTDKNDVKDALMIARLVKNARYQELIIPAGVYAELWIAMNQREGLNEDHIRLVGSLCSGVCTHCL